MEAHVLLFPWPLQGHINPMLHLASALLDAGLRVTLLHTQHNLRRLILGRVPPHDPRLRQLSIPDGLPEDHPRSVGRLMELVESMHTVGSAAYRDLLRKETAEPEPSRCSDDDDNADRPPPVTCVIADGVMPFAVSVAEDMGVPALAFRRESACGLLAYLSIPRLLELGETPVPSDEQVRGVPGMEGHLRRRDLPRVAVAPEGDADADPVPVLLTIADTVARCRDARALVLNTSVSLEGPALPHIARHMRDVFVVGPLHARACRPAAAAVEHGGLWRENDGDGCKAWLDGHKDRSVVYVNLGSLTVVSSQQLVELIHGLAATGYAFLCVLRPDMLIHRTTSSSVLLLQEAVETAVAAGAGDRALMVEWALHQDLHYVLRHRAVGCFLTHAGWNSMLEVAVEGMPTVCWPYFADQQTVSRFVGAVWKTGLDMKDVCDRAVVERMVREAMESPEIRAAAQALARQLRMDVAQGGSSSSQLERLVGFITKLRVRTAAAVQQVPSVDDVEN